MNYELRTKVGKIKKKTSSRYSLFGIRDSNREGFTLVETIVAIAILAIAMVGPLSLAQRGLNASIYARDQITSFYLAQEAIEYVRNRRDTNNLNSLSGGALWLSGLDNCIGKPCGIDSSIDPLVGAQTVDCNMLPFDSRRCLLVFNPTTGIYGVYGLRKNPDWTLPSPWRVTTFNRTMQITRVTVGDPVTGDTNGEAALVATVSCRT